MTSRSRGVFRPRALLRVEMLCEISFSARPVFWDSVCIAQQACAKAAK
jgi:hypothetical protein